MEQINLTNLLLLGIIGTGYYIYLELVKISRALQDLPKISHIQALDDRLLEIVVNTTEASELSEAEKELRKDANWYKAFRS
jgi:hypothetical protein